MKTKFCCALLCVTVCFSILSTHAQNNFTLNPLFSFGGNGDGSIRPGDETWMDAGFNQRGMAHDPVSGNVVFVDTHTGSGGLAGALTNQTAIYILDGSSGAVISTLNTNGISGTSAYAIAPAGVADDGVVYVMNQVNNSTNQAVKIYRWDSVSSTDPPVVAFNATIAPPQRYGVCMDIRGAGTNTQIIMGALANNAQQSGTNVVIFTTTDGTNFTANVISTGISAADFREGIAFGSGDTFWAKRINSPLRYMSFNLATKTATLLASYASILPKFSTLGPIAVDTNNNLLAAIEVGGGSATGGGDKVWLFDISNTNQLLLLSIRNLFPNNQNATAPAGFLDFGAGRLYAHVSNNGLLASTVDSVSTPPPTIVQQPPPTNRVAIGLTAAFEVVALPGITGYQWRTNGVDIPGATNTTLSVPNVQVADSGRIYTVLVSNVTDVLLSSNSVLSVVNPADLFHLELLWSASPGSTNYYIGTGGGTPTERTIAYNALSNQLYVVFRNGNNIRISAVDADTGEFLYNLKTNGISIVGGTGDGGNVPLCAIGVGEDGAIYACNSVAAGDPGNRFKVYRWENSDSNTVPVVIYGTNSTTYAQSANPAVGVTTAGFRWGDTIDVRGSGTNTQLIFDHQENGTFRFAGLLRPVDDTMTNWTAKGFVLQNAAGTAVIGRSLQFGEGNRFWQKRMPTAGGAPLVQSSFDPDAPDPQLAVVETTTTAPPLFNNGPIAINFTLKLGAAINMLNGVGSFPDTIELYDMTAPETPVFASRYNFPIPTVANANRIGQVIFATNRVFAIDANNGIVAYTVESGPIPPPQFLTQPKDQRLILGGIGSILATLDQTASFQWRRDGNDLPGATSVPLNFSNVQLTNAGAYTLVASNQNGMVTSLVANVTVSLPDDNYRLVKLWQAVPNSAPYVTSTGGANTPTERAFAYHALSNQLLVVSCAPASTTPVVHVVDADTGVKLYQLETNGVVHVASEVAGSNPLDLLAPEVSEDGSVYICNGVPNASGGAGADPGKMFYIYRWADSGSNALPSVVFMGDPAAQTANFRWGDTMKVRGGGTNTEIIVDSNDGSWGAILKPTDDTLTAFTNFLWSSGAGAGSIGRSLEFEGTNTYWQKRKGIALRLSSFDTNTQTSASLANYNTFPTTLGGVAVSTPLNLVIGVDYVGTAGSSPDAVGVYEVTDPLTPMLISRHNFPANMTANNNFICKTIIAGDRVFSLNGNNGMLAFRIVGPKLTIANVGDTVQIAWSTNITGATLQGTQTLSPTAWTDISASPVIVGDRYVVTQGTTNGIVNYRLDR